MRVQFAGRLFVLSFTLSLIHPGVGQAAERPMTLDEAISLALEHNEGIVIEREQLASAESEVTGAKGAYDPLLQLEGGWLRSRAPVNSAFSGAPAGALAPRIDSADAGASLRELLPTGGEISVRGTASRGTTDGAFTLLSPAYATEAGVELRQPLLRDRAIDPARFALRVTASDRTRAVASLSREVTDTIAAVEDAYWNLVETRREVSVREEAVGLAEQQLSETSQRIERGAAPETELSQPRAELERRRGELWASREALARAENGLKTLILTDTDILWADPIDPTESPETTPPTVDVPASLKKALAARPEIAEAEAGLERRRAETDFAADGVKPALDLVISYDAYGLGGSRNPAGATIPGLPTEVPDELQGGLGRSWATLGGGDFNDVRAGVVFQVPIGNRSAKAAAAVARSARRQAQAELARARKTVRAEVLDAAAAVDTASQRVEASRAAREAAEVQLSSEQERFAVGLSTNFLVLTRQNDLSRARLDEIAALIDYRKARTEMARATGSLLEEHRIELGRQN